jgi:hypothetical protein
MAAFATVILFCVFPASAQNTKGDKQAATAPGGPPIRFPKFRLKSKHGDRPNTRDISGQRRVRTKNKSSANRVIYEAPNPYKDRKYKKRGDQPAQARNRTYGAPPHHRERAWTGGINGSPQRIRSLSAQRARSNVYPQSGPYVNNPSKKPRSSVKVYTKTASGKRIIRSRPQSRQRAGGVGGNYSSASGGHVTRGRKNVYWGKFSKGERPVTKDLTGRPLRLLNFTSKGPGPGSTDTLKMAGRKPGRDRANSGGVSGGFSSASRRGEKAWTGDVSGRPLRRRPPSKGQVAGSFFYPRKLSISGRGDKAGRRIPGGGYQTTKRKKGLQGPLPSLAPGIGAAGIAHSLKKTTGYRSSKGGGSISGKIHKGGALQPRAPGIGANGIENYSGKIRSGRPIKGGGSISGKLFNNNGQPINPRAPGIGVNGMEKYTGSIPRSSISGFSREGAGFRGSIRAKRPMKGGGSISGKLFNNNGQALNPRAPGIGVNGMEKYTGNIPKSSITGFSREGADFRGSIRTKRPAKGGGSISGKLFNNDGQALNPRAPGIGVDGIEKYRGNILRSDVTGFSKEGSDFRGTMRAKRPKKGGGSISGKIFNNNGEALPVRLPGNPEAKAANYPGKIKLPWLRKKYVQNPNAFKESLKKVRPDPSTRLAGGLQVKAIQGDYRKKPHAADGSLLGIGPKNGTVRASEYDHAIKQYWSYKQNPNSKEGALKGVAPASGSGRVAVFAGHTRLSASVRHNPSSAKGSLLVHDPGKAYGRINDYQGNMKMGKYNGARLHPDAAFAHGSRDNVKEERTMMMNIRLFWAKLFRKNDTQPNAVKEKPHRPRYDRKEKELWKALYD